MENEYVKAIKLNHLSGSDLTKEGSLILFYKIPICFDLIQKIPSVELLVVNLSLCQAAGGQQRQGPGPGSKKSGEMVLVCNGD